MEPNIAQVVATLRTPAAVRTRANELLHAAEAGALEHFTIDWCRWQPVIDYVVATIKARYPSYQVPLHSRWRHFEVDGIPRWRNLTAQAPFADPLERGRAAIDLAVTSVLLDAGAGSIWAYQDTNGARYQRSEGLAIASFNAFAEGLFSGVPGSPLQADSKGLSTCTPERLGAAFQVHHNNPLVGLEGRAQLLRMLGQAITNAPHYFGEDVPRVGNLCDYFASIAEHKPIAASTVLSVILDAFSPIWPDREQLAGENLGDVWRHRAIVRDDLSNGLMPFHKLSQWLTYSLLEPLQWAGLQVTELDELTGLAEYRNGGLFIDLGLLKPRQSLVLHQAHPPGSTLVVEWRALTVALLDRLTPPVRHCLGLEPQSLPLASLLEGGTWAAGRRIAAQLRPDGGPPIEVISDGTVF